MQAVRIGLPSHRVVALVAIGILATLVGCGAQSPRDEKANKDPSATAAESVSFASTIQLGSLPNPAPWTTVAPGVEMAQVSLPVPPDSPGFADHLLLYVPAGQHKIHSLGCVFIAPAGAPMFAGNSQAEGDRKEHLPYVQAGYAVAAFDIDGEFPAGQKSLPAIRATYAKFKAAGGGVVNGKNALEYVLAKLPQVDPKRLYVAGHSSAATFALLFAEHERRIRGCIAYAPLADLFDASRGDRADTERLFPGIAAFSPLEHCDMLACPTYLFHAEDDHTISVDITRRFFDKLEQTNPAVSFQTVPIGDHYPSMIKQGIPMGIKWLKSLPGERNAAPTLPVVNSADSEGE